MTDRKEPRSWYVDDRIERDCWEIVKLSRGLADAPASEIAPETPWLQEAARNIQRALDRAKETRLVA